MSWYISSKIGKRVERPPSFTLLQAVKSSQTHNEDVHIAPISSSAFCRILATAKRSFPVPAPSSFFEKKKIKAYGTLLHAEELRNSGSKDFGNAR